MMLKHVSRKLTALLALSLALSLLAVLTANETSASIGVTYAISSSEDDAWSRIDTVGPDDASFYLSKSDMIAGLRWSIDIPEGATVERAYVNLKARIVSLSGPKCGIRLIQQDSAPPFTTVFWDEQIEGNVMWTLPAFVLG